MKRLMIVDDAAFMRASIRKMIETENYSIVGEAENGEDAVRKFKTLKPEVITMDITMPMMNGIEASKAILAIDPTVKIIMVSAMGQENYVKEAIVSGATNFIVKPFNKDTLVRVLNSIQ